MFHGCIDFIRGFFTALFHPQVAFRRRDRKLERDPSISETNAAKLPERTAVVRMMRLLHIAHRHTHVIVKCGFAQVKWDLAKRCFYPIGLKGQFHLAYADDEEVADDSHISDAGQSSAYHALASPMSQDASSLRQSQEVEPADQEPVLLDSLSIVLDTTAPAVGATAGRKRPSLDQNVAALMKMVAPQSQEGAFAQLHSPENSPSHQKVSPFVNSKGKLELDRKTSKFMQQLASRKISTAIPGPLPQTRVDQPTASFMTDKGQVALDRKTSMFMQQLATRKASNLPQPLAKQNTTGNMQQQQMKHAAQRNKQVPGVVGVGAMMAIPNQLQPPPQSVTARSAAAAQRQAQPREQEMPPLREGDRAGLEDEEPEAMADLI
jgi:hypothetical protein